MSFWQKYLIKMFPRVLCEGVPYTSFLSLRECQKVSQVGCFWCVYTEGATTKPGQWLWMRASFQCGIAVPARLLQLILNIDTTLCAVTAEAFLYPMKTMLSLLITVPCEKRHSANSAGPSSGLLLGSLLTNYDDLLCSQCRGAPCCEDDIQPKG